MVLIAVLAAQGTNATIPVVVFVPPLAATCAPAMMPLMTQNSAEKFHAVSHIPVDKRLLRIDNAPRLDFHDNAVNGPRYEYEQEQGDWAIERPYEIRAFVDHQKHNRNYWKA